MDNNPPHARIQGLDDGTGCHWGRQASPEHSLGLCVTGAATDSLSTAWGSVSRGPLPDLGLVLVRETGGCHLKRFSCGAGSQPLQ